MNKPEMNKRLRVTIERFREIMAFGDYVAQQCAEHRFTQKETVVVVACLVDHVLNNHPDSTLEQALTEINDMVRGLRKAYSIGEPEKPN